MAGKKGVAKTDQQEKTKAGKIKSKPTAKTKIERVGGRRAEERFSKAFRVSPAGMTITRIADGKFIDANEAFCRMFEFSRDEVIGHTSIELNMWTPEERKRLIDEQIRTGGLQDFELQAHAKSGRAITILFSSKPVELEGEPCLVTTMIDITERQRTEEALRENEQRLSSIYDTVGDVIFYLRVEAGDSFRFISVNSAFGRVTGLPEEAVVGKNVNEVIPKPSLSMALGKYRQAIKEKAIVRWEEVSEYPTGRLIGEVSVAPVFNQAGRCTHLVGSVRDITERKRAEERLHYQAALLAQVNDAVIASDENFVITSWNPAAEKIYGWPAEEAIGKTGETFFHSEFIGKSRAEAIAELRETGQLTVEMIQLRKDGAKVFIESRATALRDESGRTIGYLSINRDIAERKRAEEELRLSRDRLAELSRQLVQTHETESRAIGRELHDQFGQMLTALKLTLEIAAQLPPEASANKLTQARELVDDLMNRVSRLSLELRPPILDDLGLIPALLWHINRFQEHAQLTVDFRHNGVEGKRFAPEIESTAYRVIQEGLTNAARHAHATRARIEIYVEPSGVHARDGEMEIQIEDNGAGFEVETALAQNRGLGGMRERVGLLNGTFHVQSEPGKGGRIHITLPLKETA